MGCDIHPFVEVRKGDGPWGVGSTPSRLHDRTYGRFEFLTGGHVRSYSCVPVVLPSPRGYPEDSGRILGSRDEDPVGFSDCEPYRDDRHSASWLTLEELLSVDYNQKMKDPREVGCPEMTIGEFLGEGWMEIVVELRAQVQDTTKNVRIVFDFDS